MNPTSKSSYWTEKLEEEREQKASTASYIIYKEEDTGIIYAKNGDTGLVDFSGTDAATVIQNAINNIDAGVIYIKRHNNLTGKYTINQQITAKPGIFLKSDGAFLDLSQLNDTAFIFGSDSEYTPYLPNLTGLSGFYIEGSKSNANTKVAIISNIERNVVVKNLYMHDVSNGIEIRGGVIQCGT